MKLWWASEWTTHVSPFPLREPCGRKKGCGGLDAYPALNYLNQPYNFNYASHLRIKVGMETYKH